MKKQTRQFGVGTFQLYALGEKLATYLIKSHRAEEGVSRANVATGFEVGARKRRNLGLPHEAEEGGVLLRGSITQRSLNLLLRLRPVNLVEEAVVVLGRVIIGTNGVNLQRQTNAKDEQMDYSKV